MSKRSCGSASLVMVNRQRTMSRVGKLGSEMATSRERVKAQKRSTMSGTKKTRAAMTVVSDQEPRTSFPEGAKIYTIGLVVSGNILRLL
jgi:hypothetical protein